MSNDRRASEERRIAERVSIVESRQDRFEEAVNRSLRSIDQHLKTLTECVNKLHVFDERINRQRADMDMLRDDVEMLKKHVPLNSFLRDRWNKITLGIVVALSGVAGSFAAWLVRYLLQQH